jgi:GAF domain-containing protein
MHQLLHGSGRPENRSHRSCWRWLNRVVGLTGAENEAFDYAELLRGLEAAQESDAIEQALAAARAHLCMDAAYLTTIDPREQTIHAVVGEKEIVERYQSSTLPLEQTYCARMLSGEIPNVVADTRANDALRDLAATREFGAYVGVPVTLSDGTVHGSLCCVSRGPQAGLGDDELRFMQVLAGIVAVRIEQARGDMARLTERFRSA